MRNIITDKLIKFYANDSICDKGMVSEYLFNRIMLSLSLLDDYRVENALSSFTLYDTDFSPLYKEMILRDQNIEKEDLFFKELYSEIKEYILHHKELELQEGKLIMINKELNIVGEIKEKKIIKKSNIKIIETIYNN